MRDDLHGVAEVLPAPLLGDDRGVHLTGGDVGRGVQVDVEEALVVPDVQVRLGAVLGDEHLTVLERVHGARVHVEVGVELLQDHPEPPGPQEPAQAGGGEPLAEGRRDATRDEYLLRDARPIDHGIRR